jgi:hypothetical protein
MSEGEMKQTSRDAIADDLYEPSQAEALVRAQAGGSKKQEADQINVNALAVSVAAREHR